MTAGLMLPPMYAIPLATLAVVRYRGHYLVRRAAEAASEGDAV